MKTVKKKHELATKKVNELVKKNKKLEQTILLMDENHRQQKKFWSERGVIK